MARRSTCSYYRCREPGLYIVELEGSRYFLCKRHYRALLRALREQAKVKGSSELGELIVKRRGGGIIFSVP
ncbi:MAG: hypothetical protein DRK00_04650 [Thermoprotei archaeon]|nr:MAG: hypothetical protein DRK00_04650 [Thermoprotei archaeon]